MSNHDAHGGPDPSGQRQAPTQETPTTVEPIGQERSLLLDWALLIAGCGAIFGLGYLLT
jgi:hypothetical protein